MIRLDLDKVNSSWRETGRERPSEQFNADGMEATTPNGPFECLFYQGLTVNSFAQVVRAVRMWIIVLKQAHPLGVGGLQQELC